MLYSVTIDPTLLGGVAPSDGFIDPTTIQNHRARLTYTGTVTSPTVVANSQIYIRDIPVTITGTTLTEIVADINSKSFYHHVFAADSADALQLSMLPGFENLIPTLTDISGETVTAVGFDNPVVSAVPANITTIDQSLAKRRANVRWELVLETLQLTGNVDYKITNIAGANATTAPSSLEFILDVSDNYFNYDLTGEKVFGIRAIRNAIAKALMYTVKKRRDYIEPISISNDPATFVYDTPVSEITVGPLTENSATALGAILVTTVV